MIESVVALLMFVNAEIKEARLQEKVWHNAFVASVIAESEYSMNQYRYTNAGRVKAELEDNIDGSKSIKNSSSK